MEKNSYISFIVGQIEKLCSIPSPSGFTHQIVNYLDSTFQKLGFSTQITKKKSLVVDLGGEREPLLLMAHVDTLGAMVRSITSNGRLRITKVGSFSENFVETENCSIHTRDGKIYSGTFQIKNPSAHANRNAAKDKRDEDGMEVIIDEKVKTKEEVLELEIRNGDYITFDPRIKITDSGFIKSRHLDDKASAGILIGVAKYLKEMKVSQKRRTYLLFTSYEEVGHGASSGLPADVGEMISVDMGVVGEGLETDEYKVSICAKDSKGPYDYELTNRLIATAKELELNYSVDIYPFYGSDVEAALVAGYDARHALIGPGVFASHGYERTHRDALENTFQLIRGFIEK